MRRCKKRLEKVKVIPLGEMQDFEGVDLQWHKLLKVLLNYTSLP